MDNASSVEWAAYRTLDVKSLYLPVPKAKRHNDHVPTLSPARLAERGRELYAERFRQEFEPDHIGQYLAIDVEAEVAYLGQSPTLALQTAENAHREGFFYLRRIGHPGVYSLNSGRAWSRAGILR